MLLANLHWETHWHRAQCVESNLHSSGMMQLLFFPVAHLPGRARDINFLSLFIFICSIIHVLEKCVSMCTAESQRGGFGAAAAWLVPHTLHHLSHIIGDEGWAVGVTGNQESDGVGGSWSGQSVFWFNNGMRFLKSGGIHPSLFCHLENKMRDHQTVN